MCLTDKFRAQRITGLQSQAVGTAGVGQSLVIGTLSVEGQLGGTRAHGVEQDDMVALVVGMRLIGGQRLASHTEGGKGIALHGRLCQLPLSQIARVIVGLAEGCILSRMQQVACLHHAVDLQRLHGLKIECMRITGLRCAGRRLAATHQPHRHHDEDARAEYRLEAVHRLRVVGF